MTVKLTYAKGSPIKAALKNRLKRKLKSKKVSALQMLIDAAKVMDVSVTFPAMPRSSQKRVETNTKPSVTPYHRSKLS